MKYIVMNLHDIEALQDAESVFAAPASSEVESGDIIGIKEPFIRLVAHIVNSQTGEPEDDVAGVEYRLDRKRVWYGGISPENLNGYDTTVDVAPHASPAKQLPEYAVRTFRRVVSADVKHLRSFTKDDIRAMHLDYASTGDQQLLISGYEHIKDYELLYAWWKARYKSTLKKTDNPLAVILRIAPPPM